MLYRLFTLGCMLALLTNNFRLEAKQTLQFFFYEEPIEIEYDEKMRIPLIDGTSEEVVQRYHQDLTKTNTLMVISNLFYYKKELNLNDWLFYLLVQQTADGIFETETENYRTLFCWFIMQRCGYVVQLGYDENSRMALSVFTTDLIYEVPLSKTDLKMQEVYNDEGVKEIKQGYFVDLTAVVKQTKSRGTAPRYVIMKPINEFSGRAFSFLMPELPTFSKVEHETKKLSFIHDNKLYSIDVMIDKNAIYSMYKYPQMVVENYLRTPLSTVCHESLEKSLKPLLANQTPYDAVRMLLSFTRQAFDYGEDFTIYRRANITLSAEETLFYPKSDCEDRAVLFCHLAKEFLGLKTLLIDYPEHASAAVLLDKAYGDATITYNDNVYSVCDPTGPGNHLKIGETPPVFKNVPPKILKD
jgi:hypothetical protein